MKATRPERPLALAFAVSLASAALLTACGGSSSSPSTPTPGRTAAPAATSPAAGGSTGSVKAVEGQGDPQTAWRFDPAETSVKAGATVTFVNTGKEAHTATADDGSFDAGVLNPGDQRDVRFEKAGEFAFHCSFHPWMKGTVRVGT